MTAGILQRLAEGEILVADGAFGTQLQQRGLPSGHCPEEFNVSHPDLVQAIYSDYYSAGADFVSTASFGGNRPRLASHGMGDRVREFSQKAAELARAVCPEGRYVAGSIGPTGELLEPFGLFSEREAYDVFAEQAIALADGGVDFILVETMMAAQEARIAVRAAKDATRLPVAATMSFEGKNDQFRTSWGVSVEEAAQCLAEAGADIVGSNCGLGFDQMISIVKQMRSATTLPILAQANAGLPQWIDGRTVYAETPETMAPKIQAMLEAGANIIGGCCGTTPAHIAKIREIVDQFRRTDR
ncbi:MAG TPA: homocysteine S-methyltransferase family protein [Acidobacteriota bacterium]|nr:homocysteine S-methyltransferase family protein [Acidobacteriota bacterium]